MYSLVARKQTIEMFLWRLFDLFNQLTCLRNPFYCYLGYSELSPETGDGKMRKDDKAYVEIEGDFRQEETEAQPVFVQ